MRTYFVVLQRPGSRWDRGRPVREQDLWDEHAKHIDAMFEAGKILLAGPFADGGGSMLVLRAKNAVEARAMMADDPWNVEDVMVPAEVKEWTIFVDGTGAK